jgi:hypothetical protein
MERKRMLKNGVFAAFVAAVFLFCFTSCAFMDGLLGTYFDEKGFGYEGIATSMHITVTPYDPAGGSYPGSSDEIKVEANTNPAIFWEVKDVSAISEYWVFVYSPLLYQEGLRAEVLPDVWVVSEISPSLTRVEFGEVPAGAYNKSAYVWEDPVPQALKYNGTYIFWVAACDEGGSWKGLGMAKVTVVGGADLPDPPDLRAEINDVSVVDIGGGQYETTILYTVYNDGDVPAEYFETGIWSHRSSPPSVTSTDYLTTVYHTEAGSGLGVYPHQSITHSVVVTVSQPSGTAYVFADIWEAISESSELNNVSAGFDWYSIN